MIEKIVEGPSGWGKKERRNKEQREVRDPSRKSLVSNLTASGSGLLIHCPGSGKDYSSIHDRPEIGF